MSLLLFNWVGYKLVLSYLQQQSDLRLEARLDINDYDESQLMEIRVPLNLPYQSEWAAFERHYGEININGKHYTYVKRKIENGSLVLKCIANPQKDIIKNNGNAFFKIANGIDQENQKAPSPFAKSMNSFSGDFESNLPVFQINDLNALNKNYVGFITAFTKPGFTITSEQPPDNYLPV